MCILYKLIGIISEDEVEGFVSCTSLHTIEGCLDVGEDCVCGNGKCEVAEEG